MTKDATTTNNLKTESHTLTVSKKTTAQVRQFLSMHTYSNSETEATHSEFSNILPRFKESLQI